MKRVKLTFIITIFIIIIVNLFADNKKSFDISQASENSALDGSRKTNSFPQKIKKNSKFNNKKIMTIEISVNIPICDENGNYPGSKEKRDIVKKIVKFGNYFEDKGGKYKSPLEWIILDEKDGYTLLLTKNVIYSMGWVKSGKKGLTWAETDLRNWLNEDFYNEAFSELEKNSMALFNATQPQNPRYKTPAGKATIDYVSLLSYQELIQYMPTEIERRTKPTDYAISHGNYVNTYGDSAWWLRSPGPKSNIPEHLATWGNLGARDHYVDDYIIGVRPAIWVKTEVLK